MRYKAFKLDELEVKDGENIGHFTGRASVYNVVDLHNDMVVPGAFTKSLKKNGPIIKVLNQHNPYDVIGLAELNDTPEALFVKSGTLELALPSARDAYTRAKGRLVDGISIGYDPVADKFDKGVRLLTEIDLWEISLVTFPANVHARVTNVKAALDALDWDDFAAYALAERKAGRVLSGPNLTRLKQIIALCNELLSTAEPPVDEEAKATRQLVDTVNHLVTDLKTTRDSFAQKG